MREKKRGFFEGLFWVGIGAFFCVLALRFEIGSLQQPEPGFLPFLTGIFVGGLGVVLLISEALRLWRGKETHSPTSTFFSRPPGRIVYTMALLVLYAVFIDSLGFVLTTTLAMFGLFFDLKRRNWFWSVFASIATALTSYLVFEVWLRCQLPRGLFPWW